MISLTHVSKIFDGKRKATALENINLQIEKGHVVSIMGPSGSGKSTLLNLIGGLDRPTSGDIRVDGENLSELSDDDLTRVRRDKIGFVFQFFNLLPTLNCVENVALPLHLRNAVLAPWLCATAALWRIAADDAVSSAELALSTASSCEMDTHSCGHCSGRRRVCCNAYGQQVDLQRVR